MFILFMLPFSMLLLFHNQGRGRPIGGGGGGVVSSGVWTVGTTKIGSTDKIS